MMSTRAFDLYRQGKIDAATQAMLTLPPGFAAVGEAVLLANRSRLADPAFASGATLRAHLDALGLLVSVIRRTVARSAAWDTDATLVAPLRGDHS